MFNESSFTPGWPWPNHRHFVGIATQVANAYLAAQVKLTVVDVDVAIANVNVGAHTTAEAFRNALVEELNYDHQVAHTPPAAMRVNLNPPPPPPWQGAPPLGSRQKAADRQTIATMRTPASRRAGVALANAAKSLEDLFHWTPRGESQVLPWEPPPTTAVGQRNFAIWLQSTGFEEPGHGTALNCWESVLFSAYKAQLITKGQLLAMYMEAEAAFRRLAEPDVKQASKRGPGALSFAQQQRIAVGYNDFLSILNARFLRSEFSVRVDLNEALIPQPGDLIMVNGDFRNHIAIALGRKRIGGAAVDRVMSLYHHNAGRMAEIPLEALGDNLTFRPCPF